MFLSGTRGLGQLRVRRGQGTGLHPTGRQIVGDREVERGNGLTHLEPSFMNGVPELLILRLLSAQTMYGYEIVQAIREQTESAVTLGEGVVYPVLHALERDGALKSRRKKVDGRSRIYYALTAKGRSRLAELVGTWSRVSGGVQRLLTGGDRAQPA